MAKGKEAEQVTKAEPERVWGEFEPTEEMIDRMMNRLEAADPEKAQELTKLREESPERFKKEIIEIMRERMRQMIRERQGQGGFGGGYGAMGMQGREGGRDEAGGPGGRERIELEGREARTARSPERTPSMMTRMRGGMRMSPQEKENFMKWLGENYPDEVKKLSELKEKNPELFERQFYLIWMKYRRIYHAVRENPELAEIFKEQHELNSLQERLLRRIGSVKDEKEKKELIERLGEVLSKKFDLIVRRKQIAYEQLLRRLKELEKYVRESEAKVEEWQNPEFKKEQVKARIEELVGKEKKFDWD